MKYTPAICVLFLSSGLAGCGVLFGNVRPIAEKSDRFSVVDLSENQKNWVKLSTVEESTDSDKGLDEDASQSASSDLAWQSAKTASIISLNSACRTKVGQSDRDLRSWTDELLLSFSRISARAEKPVTVDGRPALATVVSGTMDGQLMKLSTVVLKDDSCLYDLMYVAKEEHFADEEADFSTFVASLHVE